MAEQENRLEIFRCTYSAEQQKKVNHIRTQYVPREENVLEQLGRLDRKARRFGTVLSLTLGIVSTLVMGAGMSLVLVWAYWNPGLVVGILVLIGMCVNYPVYKMVNKRQKAKYAPEILRLNNALMGNR